MQESKPCSRCKQIKPFTEFNKKASTPTGYNTACRACANEMKRNLTPQQRARKQLMKRNWDANNLDKVKMMNTSAYKNKPEMFINNASKRYAKIKNVDRRLIRAIELKSLKAKPCIYCGSTKQIEIDHIIPIARGGRHSIGNLAPACRACNRSKTDYFVMEWRKKRETPRPTHRGVSCL